MRKLVTIGIDPDFWETARKMGKYQSDLRADVKRGS